MPRKKWFFTSSAILLCSTMLLAACSSSSNSSTSSSSSQNTTTSTSSLSSGEASTTLDKIDSSRWQYNADNSVYCQIGISYATNPTDAEQQTLSILVPGDYMTATDNGDGTYTCEIDTLATVGNHTSEAAPIAIPVNTPGYSAMSVLTEYISDATDYTSRGMIHASAGLRGRDSGAPGGVTDAKAAIRYLRYNQGNISENTDSIFVLGTSGSGAQSAITGSSGDSSLYDDCLTEIGAAEGVSDSVAGVMAWYPITNLDTANEAYERNMGPTRSDLSDREQIISDGSATAFVKYTNRPGPQDGDDNKLTLKKSDGGIYQVGSYYNYLKSVTRDSLNTFLANTTLPYDASSSSQGGLGGGDTLTDEVPTDLGTTDDITSIEDVDDINRTSFSLITIDLSGTHETAADYIAALNADLVWVTYDEDINTVSISSIADFIKYMRSSTKSLGVFDALDLSQGEDQPFGYDDSNSVRWDLTLGDLVKGINYEEVFITDLAKTDSSGNNLTTRINTYTPLYYLTDYCGGENSSNVASYWWIRTGLSQDDTVLTTEVNLALVLENYGVEDLDFAMVWGEQYTETEISGDSTSNFID